MGFNNHFPRARFGRYPQRLCGLHNGMVNWGNLGPYKPKRLQE